MRTKLAALLAASLLILIAAPLAEAATTSVDVRIEGREKTLYEGSVPVSVKKIRASSDGEERDCDGVNGLDPENVAPAATPTLASAEAMESIGETFDGQWYSSFGDYFITRWGPDSQNTSLSIYWGVLVNEVYANVGGCQYQLNENDEVLWIWDAFEGRPTLALYPVEAGYDEGPRPTEVIAQPGQPVPVEVVAFPDDGEGVPGDRPARAGSTPYAGAAVAPVSTDAKGFQRVDSASPEAVSADADGRATLTFDEPGIHRVKATVGSPGSETTVVRSNGLTICVPASFGDCGEVEPAQPSPSSSRPAPAPGRLRIGTPRVDRSRVARGRVFVSWQLLDPGPGVERWQIASKRFGGKRGGFVPRASGRDGTRAAIRLPRGAKYKLRLSVTDLNGGTTEYGLGKVSIPREDAD